MCVKAGQKLQDIKLVGNDNMKSKLELWENLSRFLRIYNQVPKLGSNARIHFCSKAWTSAAKNSTFRKFDQK